MACRAPFNAQALGHIWVSDEALTRALRRFERVSLAHKRYGSHVPGPMEAHRRSSNRRRFGIALTTPAVPALFDFEHLLGNIWPKSAHEPEQSWKWTAPKEYGEEGSRIIPSLNDRRLDMEKEADMVTKSASRFKVLLHNIRTEQNLQSSTINPCLDFLLSASDIAEAGNMVQVARFMAARQPTREAIASFLQTVSVKTRLEPCLSQSMAASLATLWTVPTCQRRARPSVRRALVALKPQHRHDVVMRTTMLIHDAGSDFPAHDSAGPVVKWFNMLHDISRHQQQSWDGIEWRKLYQVVQDRLNPIHLQSHLSKLQPFEISCTLIHHWLPYLIAEESPPVDRGIHLVLNLARPSDLGDMSALSDDMIQQFEKDVGTIADRRDPVVCFARLVRLLARNNLPYSRLYKTLHDIWSVDKSLDERRTVSQRLLKHLDDLRAPPSLLENVIHLLIEADTAQSVKDAHDLFVEYPSVSGTSSVGIPLALLKHGYLTGRWPSRIFKVLSRRTAIDLDAMPPPAAVGAKTLRMSQGQIQATEDVALVWATHVALSPRHAYRLVWSCYRFLQDRGVSISSTILRALIEAGIMRHVVAGHDIPQRQLDYILSLVVQIEGIATAEKLQQKVSEWRLNNTHKPFRHRGLRKHTPRIGNAFRVRPWSTRQRFMSVGQSTKKMSR